VVVRHAEILDGGGDLSRCHRPKAHLTAAIRVNRNDVVGRLLPLSRIAACAGLRQSVQTFERLWLNGDSLVVRVNLKNA